MGGRAARTVAGAVWVLLLARRCAADRIVVEARGHVGDGWSVSGAGCRTPAGSGSCQPVVYEDIHAQVGDTLLFRYRWFHDVFLSTLPDKNCDFSSGRVVAGADAGGGDGFQYVLTDPGTFVFSCTRSGNRPGWEAIGSHCASGQVVKVVVTPAASGAEAPADESRCSLDGTWDTTYDAAVQVQGQQGSYLGIWGDISEIEWSHPNVVVGRFHNGDLGRDGHFSWTVDGDCNSFTGQYGWAGEPVSGRWDGHRVSSSTTMTGDGMQGFAGPFEGMGISGHNDLGSALASGPAECADRCADLAACQSFDWGAREHVHGECWLSTANRASAGDAYSQWPLYDYYEKALTPSGSTRSSAVGSSAADETRPAEAPPPGFTGPFEGMGISGYNDLGSALASGPAECADRCADLAACQSFDWGAREHVHGECWLSTANRASAGDAYSQWPLYDYYEKVPAPHATSSAVARVRRGRSSALPAVGLIVALALGACARFVWQRRCRGRSPGVNDSSAPTAIVVQAAPVLPLPLHGEVVSLCPVAADGTAVVVAEEVKARHFAYALPVGGASGGGSSGTGTPGGSRRCSV